MARKKKSPSIKSRLSKRFGWLRHWLKAEPGDLTVLLMTKGQLEVEKVHFSPKTIKLVRAFGIVATFFVIVSAVIFLQFLVSLPDRSLLKQENVALKKELQKLSFHLDTLQTSVDRVNRFNQKLRALTEVDKEFTRRQGPLGQGGVEEASTEVFDFGDFVIEEGDLDLEDSTPEVMGREQRFFVQRLYSWASRLYRDTELEQQSVEELFEVLKGRKLQLAATPSIMPVRGWVTSHFGYRVDPFNGRRALHKGMDIAARRGVPIMVPAEGVVSFAGRYGSFGNTIKIFHGYGVSTLYAHLGDVVVRPGQKVKRGDIIGTVGSTGRSTGTHVHYEVSLHGVRVDPKKYILDRSL